MRQKVLVFANNSTHQADYCLRLVDKMNFKSDEPSQDLGKYANDSLVFFDVEVFPNLFVVSWKYEGDDKECVHMINPTSQDIEELMKMKLVGFNCRRYDNHILYARYISASVFPAAASASASCSIGSPGAGAGWLVRVKVVSLVGKTARMRCQSSTRRIPSRITGVTGVSIVIGMSAGISPSWNSNSPEGQRKRS